EAFIFRCCRSKATAKLNTSKPKLFNPMKARHCRWRGKPYASQYSSPFYPLRKSTCLILFNCLVASLGSFNPLSLSSSEGHFVDRHQIDLIKRVSNINPILDHLLKEEVLTQEQYDKAREIRTTQEQMRFLFRGPLKAGEPSKDELLSALEKEEKCLITQIVLVTEF
uniref:CARD domain-containing protein n=1 Tax=Neogobius melanostomus TaxID=47308 RepID=A0A8C6WM62_9GOBI